ncbi:MAG: protein kinase [Verrucomicrobia bacterium]|nr:protein kinase [Verrucomicrobiota bacterium]
MFADHFHPEKLLAVGPATKVYRGSEPATGRKVLIKALLADHEATNPLDRERLQLLAPALMQVRHPQIAGLITLLPTEDEFALIYEFMPGISGRAFPQERTLSPADVKALAVQLMNALLVGEHLRQPHGDLKPSNLILSDHPGGGLFIQVQDWGLTLARHTQSAETLWFRAPELHSGGAFSSQSDLFTAAASLFFLATGAAPAQGNTAEEILADLGSFDLRGSLSVMRPDIDQSFVDWLAWLLNPAPSLRPASIGQALDLLMRSMQSGFVYQAQQAPQMAPGAATGLLIAGPGAGPMPRPVAPPRSAAPQAQAARAPQSKPIQAAKKKPETTPAPAQKRINAKVVIGILLNVAALLVMFWLFRPYPDNAGFNQWWSAADADAESIPAAVASATKTKSPGLKGRHIRIAMKGSGILSLAEVQVFSGADNIAYQGTATQSSEEWGGTADLAIDGNTDGVFDHKSVTHTQGNQSDPRWQLDLGRELMLNEIVIWNRTDKAEYNERLKNFTVQVLNAQQSVIWEKTIQEVPSPSLKLVPGQ